MRAKSDVLDHAILGLLHRTPMHGYELRKQLNLVLGSFRALSYGSLYPALRSLAERGLIHGVDEERLATRGSRRARIVYQLTAAGKEHLDEVLGSVGPSAWDDEEFDVRFSLFGQVDAETRLRILEGRRMRLTERLDLVGQSLARARERMDGYTAELQRHGLETVEREVAWLDQLIDHERAARSGNPGHEATNPGHEATKPGHQTISPGHQATTAAVTSAARDSEKE
ncbi:MAG: PadR family transcriptional regulator [Cellulomonas sp.]|nr:PadR family transcriptional regulator [Cellulomonas sp.]